MHKMRLILVIIAAAGLAAVGCGGNGGAKENPKETPKEEPKAVSKDAPKEAPKEEPKEGPHPGLLDPSKASEKAPDEFKVKFETSAGDFTIEVHRAWSPRGADRFYNLVKIGFYDDTRFFRVLKGFVAQFGISGDPAVNAVWKDANILDDPVVKSNKRGYITYAMGGRHTRTSQVFISYRDNSSLDRMGFSPFGKVVEGMDTVDKLYSDYGEGAPRGSGPNQTKVQSQGNKYLNARFPKLDYVKKATIVKD